MEAGLQVSASLLGRGSDKDIVGSRIGVDLARTAEASVGISVSDDIFIWISNDNTTMRQAMIVTCLGENWRFPPSVSIRTTKVSSRPAEVGGSAFVDDRCAALDYSSHKHDTFSRNDVTSGRPQIRVISIRNRELLCPNRGQGLDMNLRNDGILTVMSELLRGELEPPK